MRKWLSLPYWLLRALGSALVCATVLRGEGTAPSQAFRDEMDVWSKL